MVEKVSCNSNGCLHWLISGKGWAGYIVIEPLLPFCSICKDLPKLAKVDKNA